jgi:DUF4097 and DUF4098 domain-containing protein YvlB
MPKFQTPEPITAVVEVVAGSVWLTATDRHDTVVEIAPRDPSRASDVRLAEQARVDFSNNTLVVSAGRRFISLGRGGAVTIDIELPTRSRLQASSASAEVRAAGEYSDCKLASASGDMTVESVVGKLKADTASGDVAVEAVKGSASVATASGNADLGELAGAIKYRAASGSLTLGWLRGDVNAQTSSGDITVAAAVKGAVAVQTSSGEVVVGIAEGTGARLDVRTGSGVVRNALRPSDGPADGDETLAVHVLTGSGDVVVQRASADAMS